MTKPETLGNFEQMVLTAVMRLGAEAYGVAINDKVGEIAGKPTNLGSVYVTLDRLEAKGYLSSKLTEPLPERGGQPKRYYQMKADGVRVLNDSMRSSKRVSRSFLETWRPGKWNSFHAS
ncbi:MAG TPA: PadR family transcriptional regulator [Terriglobia bacterium]|nr:PadR family transcriptional regulator [Terriglobia bacterium]